MADDDDDEEEEEEGGGGKKKKLIMIVGVLAIGGAAYQFVLKPSPPPDELADTAMEEEMEEEIVEGEIVELDEMILNIGGPDDAGFLRIGIALVLDDMTPAAEFETETAIAKDVAIQYLSSLAREQLETAEGRDLAKEELGAKIRAAYDDEKVVRILFTALVMQ